MGDGQSKQKLDEDKNESTNTDSSNIPYNIQNTAVLEAEGKQNVSLSQNNPSPHKKNNIDENEKDNIGRNVINRAEKSPIHSKSVDTTANISIYIQHDQHHLSTLKFDTPLDNDSAVPIKSTDNFSTTVPRTKTPTKYSDHRHLSQSHTQQRYATTENLVSNENRRYASGKWKANESKIDGIESPAESFKTNEKDTDTFQNRDVSHHHVRCNYQNRKTDKNVQDEFKTAITKELVSCVGELQQSHKEILGQLRDYDRQSGQIGETTALRIEDAVRRLKMQELRSQAQDGELDVLSNVVEKLSATVDKLCHSVSENESRISFYKKEQLQESSEKTNVEKANCFNVNLQKGCENTPPKKDNMARKSANHYDVDNDNIEETADMSLTVDSSEIKRQKVNSTSSAFKTQQKNVANSKPVTKETDISSRGHQVPKTQQANIPNIKDNVEIHKNELGFKRKLTKLKGDNRVFCLEQGVPERCKPGNDDLQPHRPNIVTEQAAARGNNTSDPSSKSEVFSFESGARKTGDIEEKLATMRTKNGNEYRNLVTNPSRLAQEHEQIDEGLWAVWAQEELDRAQTLRTAPVKGPGTVLLLDISASMEGQPFRDMVKLAKTFINEIEKISLNIGVTENVALVTFGHETRVVQHMNTDYKRIVSCIDNLRPDGPSPLGGGLLMALAAAIGKGCITTFLDVVVLPRIIVISDGKATPDAMLAGPDEEPDTFGVIQIQFKLRAVANDLKRRGNRIFCIPVGKSNPVHLEFVANTTGGKTISPDNLSYLIWMYRNYAIAMQVKNDYDMSKLDDAALGAIAGSLLNNDITLDDVGSIIEFAKDPQILALDPEGLFEKASMHKEIPDSDMPPIGTRVKRGPDWQWKDQDLNGPGTVVGHQKKGWIHVTWDKNNNTNVYRYGEQGFFDLVTCNEPRVLKSDELIATGCAVKRGADWKWNEQDGGDGNIGCVVRVDENGWIGVKWPSGKMFNHRYGAEDSFDLQICGENDVREYEAKHDRKYKSTDKDKTKTDRQSKSQQSERSEIIDTLSPSVDEMNKRNRSAQKESGTDKQTFGAAYAHKSKKDGSSTTDTKQSFKARDKKAKPSGSEENHAESLNDMSTKERQRRGKDPLRASPKEDVTVVKDCKQLCNWSYKTREGTWIDYSTEIRDKIEAAYTRKSTATTVIKLQNKIYRIHFPKMIQIDIDTKECSDVRRTAT